MKSENIKELLRDIVGSVAGRQMSELADILYGKNPVNEFTIARKLGLTINQTRNLLYKLSDYGMVEWSRKKDNKKGWYTYFWRILPVKSLILLKNNSQTRLEHLNNQISSREKNQYYVCKSCSIEFNEQDALLNDFVCDECEDLLEPKDNSQVLRGLKRHAGKLQEKIGLIEEAVEFEKERISKQKERDVEREKSKKSSSKKSSKKTTGKKSTSKASKPAKKKTNKKSAKKTTGKKSPKKTSGKKTTSNKPSKKKSSKAKKTTGKKSTSKASKPAKKKTNKKSAKKTSKAKKSTGKKSSKKSTKKSNRKKK